MHKNIIHACLNALDAARTTPPFGGSSFALIALGLLKSFAGGGMALPFSDGGMTLLFSGGGVALLFAGGGMELLFAGTGRVGVVSPASPKPLPLSMMPTYGPFPCVSSKPCMQ